MASTTEDVIVRYKAEVDQLEKELDVIIAKQEQLVKGEKSVGTESKKAVTSQEFAAKKRKQLINAEEAELRKLTQLRRLAYDPKVIEEYNKRIKASEKNITTLNGDLAGFGKTGTSVFASIGAGIAAAFTVQAITQFAKASIGAFLEAEESATRLRFAVESIGGEGEIAFQTLINQASKFQKELGVADESIQAAQAALISFGLSSAQVEQAIPVLLDYAAVTGTDVVQATQAMGQAIQGRSLQFKKFGVQVSETNTEVENFNNVISVLSSQQGAAARSTQTLSGQLKIQQERVNEMQEQVGKGLAPAWVAVQKAVFSATLAVIDFFKSGGLGFKPTTDLTEVERAYQDITAAVEKQAKAHQETGFTRAESQKNAIKDIRFEINQRLALRIEEAKAIEQNKEASIEEKKFAVFKIQQVKNELSAIKSIEAARQAQLASEADLLSAEQIRLKTTEELNKLLTENSIKNSINAQSNVKLINRELEERKKVASEADKLRQKELDEIAKNNALLRKLQIDNIEDLKQRRIASFEEETKAITAKGELRNKIIRELEIQLVKDLNDIDRDQEFDNFTPQIEALKRSAAEKINLVTGTEEHIARITKQIEERLNRDLEEIYKKRRELRAASVPTELTVPLIRTDVEMNDGIASVEASEAAIIETNNRIEAATVDLVNSLSSLYAAFTNARIEQINKELDAQLASLDTQEKFIESSLENRRISEKQALAQKEALEKRRLQVTEDAAKKERAIKRKQLILDKAAALVEIAISTAKNIASTKIPILIALYAAAGAAQAAIVASQPIPYEKGSKDTGSKGHMALVGEKGKEAVFMPPHSKVLPNRQTIKNGEAIDAMFNNRFDEFISRKYVAPALVAQKKENERASKKEFSRDLAESVIVNVAAAPASKKLERAFITNPDDLAESIIKGLRKSPYR